MYSLYIHIPFCRQACHYCDFHFSTTLKRKPQMVKALCKELELRRVEASTPLQTIYFGGGTPSVLTSVELQEIFSITRVVLTMNLQYFYLSLERNSSTSGRYKYGTSFFQNQLSISIVQASFSFYSHIYMERISREFQGSLLSNF